MSGATELSVGLIVRSAVEGDLDFGPNPVAHLLVVARHGRAVGMGQWTRIYDMFWGIYGARVEWLYVRPESRGLGIPAAIVAETPPRPR